jgi:hypothetical protein
MKELLSWLKHNCWNALAVLSLLGLIFFSPLFNYGETNLYSKIVGPKMSIELSYPPINENQILAIYKNIGGEPITGLHGNYTTSLSPTGPFRNKIAELSDKNIFRGQEGEFLINISNIRNKDCKLLTEEIFATTYYDVKNNKCYFSIEPKLEGFCTPGEVIINLVSNEKDFQIKYYYPLSVNHTKFNFYGFNGTVVCEEVFNAQDYTYLPYQKDNITREFYQEMGLDSIIQLSKKYCHEGNMPLKWCAENDLN